MWSHKSPRHWRVDIYFRADSGVNLTFWNRLIRLSICGLVTQLYISETFRFCFYVSSKIFESHSVWIHIHSAKKIARKNNSLGSCHLLPENYVLVPLVVITELTYWGWDQRLIFCRGYLLNFFYKMRCLYVLFQFPLHRLSFTLLHCLMKLTTCNKKTRFQRCHICMHLGSSAVSTIWSWSEDIVLCTGIPNEATCSWIMMLYSTGTNVVDLNNNEPERKRYIFNIKIGKIIVPITVFLIYILRIQLWAQLSI